MDRCEDNGMGAKALTLTSDELDAALDSDQIRLLYQPIFSLVDGALVRVEALCRWDHPRFGTMLPAVFLPAFEAENRLHALTKAILERGAAEFASWPLRSPAALSINLAPHDCVDQHLPALVASVLSKTSLLPEKLHLECPIRVSDHDEARPVFAALRAMGVFLVAELMGRSEDVADVFDIAPFHEVKTGGRGLLRAARNNHTASLTSVSELINFAQNKDAIVTAIGAEDEAACQALKTVGFHQIQANVLSPALPIDGITPLTTSRARQILGFEQAPRTTVETPQADHIAAEPSPFEAHKRLLQGHALRRAAELKGSAPAPDTGAKAMQSKLSRSFGEAQDGASDPSLSDSLDIQSPSEESSAGLLMRTDLAAASLGYGASPLRPAPKPKPKADPEASKEIAEVLDLLPAQVAVRSPDWDEKAEELDAEVAKLPALDDDLARDVAMGPASDDLVSLAYRLRPESKRKGNFLTRRYKLNVTHFWPRSWRQAWNRVRERQEVERWEEALKEQRVIDALKPQEIADPLGGPRGQQDTIPVVPESDEHTLIGPVNPGATASDKGPQSIELADKLGPLEARQQS